MRVTLVDKAKDNRNAIAFIKLIRFVTGFSLKNAKEYLDANKRQGPFKKGEIFIGNIVIEPDNICRKSVYTNFKGTDTNRLKRVDFDAIGIKFSDITVDDVVKLASPIEAARWRKTEVLEIW